MKRRKGLSRPRPSGLQKFFWRLLQTIFLAGFIAMLGGMIFIARMAGMFLGKTP